MANRLDLVAEQRVCNLEDLQAAPKITVMVEKII